MKKLNCVVCLVLMFFFASSCMAVDVLNWFTGAVDGDWNNTANWSMGYIPFNNVPDALSGGDAQWTVISDSAANSSFTAVDAFTDRLTIGALDGQTVALDVQNGSNLYIKYEFLPGYAPNTNATLNLDGTAYCEAFNTGLGAGSTTTINIADGGNFMVGWWGAYVGINSSVNINLDGTAYFGTYNFNQGLVMNGNGHIDIEAGHIAVSGNFVDQLNGYRDNGWITAYDGIGIVNDAFVNEYDWTIMTATIPEPATMLILSVGGLLISIRKK